MQNQSIQGEDICSLRRSITICNRVKIVGCKQEGAEVPAFRQTLTDGPTEKPEVGMGEYERGGNGSNG